MPCNFLPRALKSVLLLAGLAGITVPSASAAVQNRIAAAASNTSRVTVADSVHPKVRLASDLGAAPADTQLHGMTIRFTLTAAQQAALDQLVKDQQNPSSPQYRQWLTPAQYAAQFGLSSDDIAKVTSWLTSQGFTVTGVAHSGTFVTFDGTVAQTQNAFSTSIHSLSLHGETHLANVTNISVPSAFGSVVLGVTGLQNFRLKPRIRTQVANPQFTSSVTGSHWVSPSDFYTIYNEGPLLAKSINGTGVSIAIMGETDIIPTDIATFRTLSGLSANAPTVILDGCDPGIYNALTRANQTCDGGYTPTSDDLAEASLDLEWAGAVAPAANILFINSSEALPTSITYAVDNKVAPILSVSYGDCESAWGTTELNAMNQLFEQANAQGETVVAPGGDDGAADCDDGEDSGTGYLAYQGLAVDFPGSSPYVTSMGGTQFNGDAAATCATGATCNGTTPGDYSSTPYWSGTPNSTDVISSALSYIPEVVWNEDTTGYQFSATGGGPSAYFPKPAWQQGTGVPNDASRDVPDLALNSAPGHDALLYCANGSCAVGFRSANGSVSAAGGTSFATPTFAAILALVEQKNSLTTGMGNVNPTIYALANSTAYYTPGLTTASLSTVVFNDIVSGNNDDPCLAETPNCAAGGSIGFNAGNGYDEATGWGSINIANLANDWTAVKPLGVGSAGINLSTTTLIPSASSVAAGATVTLAATVTGNGTIIPTGTIQFLVNGAIVGSGTLMTVNGTGQASYTYTTSCSNLARLNLPSLPSSRINSTEFAGIGSSPAHLSLLGAGSGAAVACMFLLPFARKRRLGSLLLAILAIALVGGATGCGSGGKTVATTSTAATATQSYNGLLTLEASYSGDTNYTGSIAGGIGAAGAITSTFTATPITVIVTPGTCTV
jgi:subtilase family serine protease